MIFTVKLNRQTLAATATGVCLFICLAGHDFFQVVAVPLNFARNYECQQRFESSRYIDGEYAPELGMYIYDLDNEGSLVCLNLSRVQRDKENPTGAGHWLMQFEIISNDGNTRPFCLPDNEGQTWALAYKEDNGIIRLTCTRGAYAKCMRLGYVPWTKYRGSSLAPYHKACIMLMRADYLGDGSSHTTPGIGIDISDNLGILQPSPHAMFEAGWDQHGAVCIRQWRLPHSNNNQLISIVKRLRGGYGKTSCDFYKAKNRGAIMFSGKYL